MIANETLVNVEIHNPRPEDTGLVALGGRVTDSRPAVRGLEYYVVITPMFVEYSGWYPAADVTSSAPRSPVPGINWGMQNHILSTWARVRPTAHAFDDYQHAADWRDRTRGEGVDCGPYCCCATCEHRSLLTGRKSECGTWKLNGGTSTGYAFYVASNLIRVPGPILRQLPGEALRGQPLAVESLHGTYLRATQQRTPIAE